MKKIVRIGSARDSRGSVFCLIAIEDGELSISGVVNPKPNGDCDSCGQLILGGWEIGTYAPGWSAELDRAFAAIWRRWHLNHMVPGSPAQESFLREIGKVSGGYTAARDALVVAGLEPDTGYIVDGKPYSYGSMWLREDLPDEVVDFLTSLPDADSNPAWI